MGRCQWVLSGRKVAQAGIFVQLCGRGIVLPGANFSLIMSSSRVRPVLTSPRSWPVYLPECVMHWRCFQAVSPSANRGWGRWEWTSADGRFTQSLSVLTEWTSGKPAHRGVLLQTECETITDQLMCVYMSGWGGVSVIMFKVTYSAQVSDGLHFR